MKCNVIFCSWNFKFLLNFLAFALNIIQIFYTFNQWLSDLQQDTGKIIETDRQVLVLLLMFCWNYAAERWKWFDMQKRVWNEVEQETCIAGYLLLLDERRCLEIRRKINLTLQDSSNKHPLKRLSLLEAPEISEFFLRNFWPFWGFHGGNSGPNLLVSVCRVTCMTAVTMDMGVTPTAMGRGQRTPLVSWSKAAIRRWTSASSQRNGHSWTKAAAGTSWRPRSEWCADQFKTSVTACCIVNILQYNSITSPTV